MSSQNNCVHCSRLSWELLNLIVFLTVICSEGTECPETYWIWLILALFSMAQYCLSDSDLGSHFTPDYHNHVIVLRMARKCRGLYPPSLAGWPQSVAYWIWLILALFSLAQYCLFDSDWSSHFPFISITMSTRQEMNNECQRIAEYELKLAISTFYYRDEVECLLSCLTEYISMVHSRS